MSCELQKEGGKLFAVLSFHREQLLYDIRNASFIEGSVIDPETPEHKRHMVQDVGEEGNVDRVSRILDLTVAKVKELLYTVTHYKIDRISLDDKFKEQKVYGIILKVSEDFSQTTLNLLEQLIHELLVCEAVAEWMRLTNPGKAESWKQKAMETTDEIKRSINVRASRSRIRQHWLI